MPPLALASLLQHSLPWLSPHGRAVVNTLICDNGRVGSIITLCDRLGLRSRYQLGRLLQREGLPPYEELAGWICVFSWMLRADAGVGRGRLRPLAGLTHMDSATSYRLVRRVTGKCWKDLRLAGTTEVVRWFQQRTRRPHVTGYQTDLRLSAPDPHPPLPPLEPLGDRRRSRVARLPLSGAPYGIAVRGGDVAYVTRGHFATIECLDLNTGQFTTTIPVGCTPTCVTFDPCGERAYVSVQHLGEIAVIDAHRHIPIQAWRVPGDPFPLVLSPNGRTLFVTTNEDRLLALATQNGHVVGSLALPATSHHLAIHPAGDRLYVATRAAGVVLEVDATRYTVLRTFMLGGWPQGLVVSPDGTTLYVANEHHGLDVIRLGTGTRIARLDSERGAVPLSLSPDHRFLYTGLVHAGEVGVIRRESLTRHGTLAVGGRPGQIAFQRGGNAIISNEAGWVDIVPIGELRFASLPAPLPMIPAARTAG